MLDIIWRERNLRVYYYFYKGELDGIEGPQLKNAYGEFQKFTGLEVDYIYGVNTDSKLVSCIKYLQSLLNKYGYGLVEDGLAGELTYNAVVDFQKRYGLQADGLAGPATFAKLEEGNITWDDIPHFQPSEMTCECGCGLNNTDLRLMQVLEQIRSHFGDRPVFITSGCRCPEYNARVGGIAGSMHTYGKAADFYVQGVPVNELLAYCEELVRQGIISYTYTNNTNMNGVVHINL